VQWWEVDIITISLALSEEDLDIDKELEEVLEPSSNNATRKIVFAAAGQNKGANEELAWPARKEHVIAIHATDGYGTAANINPSGDKKKVNFATLGRNIPMEWFCDGCKGDIRYISGTSFATPIAAAIAANVLEFASNRLKLTKDQKARLFSHTVMWKILRAMSAPKGDYNYLQPWTMWEKAERGDWPGLKLEKDNPNNICTVLKSIIGKG